MLPINEKLTKNQRKIAINSKNEMQKKAILLPLLHNAHRVENRWHDS